MYYKWIKGDTLDKYNCLGETKTQEHRKPKSLKCQGSVSQKNFITKIDHKSWIIQYT